MGILDEFDFGNEEEPEVVTVISDEPITPEQLAQLADADANASGAGAGVGASEPDEPKVNIPAEAFDPATSVMNEDVIDVDEAIQIGGVKNFAMLVTLRTGRWTGRVKDNKARDDAAAASGASADSGDFIKKLMAGADAELRSVHKSIEQARHAYYRMTYPWVTQRGAGIRAGARLLPNHKFFEFTELMQGYKDTVKTSLATFIAKYPELREQAKGHLGAMYNANEYPDPADIASQFVLSVEFSPIPDGNDFAGLENEQLKALAEKMNDRVRAMLGNALHHGFGNIVQALDLIAKRLVDDDQGQAQQFKKTMFDTLAVDVESIMSLTQNVLPKLEPLRQEIYDDVVSLADDPKMIRTNDSLRRSIATNAARLSLKLKGLGYGIEDDATA